MEDGEKVQRITEYPPAIVVLGQTNYAKARIVNALLSSDVLPLPLEETSAPWRTVHFKFGHNPSVGLILPDNYELAFPLASNSQTPGDAIPVQDLEVNLNDSAHGCAVLEVKLNNSLLRDRSQIIVAPSSHGISMAQVYSRCTDDVLPIVIYAIGQETLSPVVSCQETIVDLVSCCVHNV